MASTCERANLAESPCAEISSPQLRGACILRDLLTDLHTLSQSVALQSVLLGKTSNHGNAVLSERGGASDIYLRSGRISIVDGGFHVPVQQAALEGHGGKRAKEDQAMTRMAGPL